MEALTINGRIIWSEFVPEDGGNCAHCGDALFLRSFSASLIFTGGALDLDLHICGSCGEDVK